MITQGKCSTETLTSISLERLDTTSMGELFSEWTVRSAEENAGVFLWGPYVMVESETETGLV